MTKEARNSTSADFEGVAVHAGFPNPALDSSLENLDLNRLLIEHPSATFYMEIQGSQWNDEGIYDGDIAVIDRVLPAKKNDKVIWIHDDTFAISMRHRVPADSEVWGVVTSVIHRFYKKSHPAE